MDSPFTWDGLLATAGLKEGRSPQDECPRQIQISCSTFFYGNRRSEVAKKFENPFCVSAVELALVREFHRPTTSCGRVNSTTIAHVESSDDGS